MKVAVLGLGKLGLPFAAVANKHHKVIGVDVNEKQLEAIRNNAPIQEPLVNDWLSKFPLEVTSDIKNIEGAKIIFIFVNTEHKDEYSANSVLKVLEGLVPFADAKVIAINCTLEPGTFEEKILPFLDKKELTDRIVGICYNPIMVAMGEAVSYFERPNFIMIGESNREAGLICETFYKEMIGEKVPVIRSNLRNVEILKYVLNLALINRISMMNFLGEYCEQYGGDVDFLAQVFQYDERITGKKMLKAGLGYGGPCFPLDSRAFKKTLTKKQLGTNFVDSIMQINERQLQRIVDLVISFNRKTVAVLGLTYKPGVPYTMESQAVDIVARLREKLFVKVFDPQGLPDARQILGNKNITYCKNALEAITESEVVLVAVPWNEFATLDPAVFKKNQIVVDPWRLYKGKKISARYIPLGVSSQTE